MLFSKKIASFLLFIMTLGSTAVFAQATQSPQQLQQKIEVSDIELIKFGKAFQQIQMVSQQAQQDMMKVVEKEGMEVPRFNEIYQATLNPEIEVTTSEEENVKQQKILAELESMRASFQQKIEKVILDEGLTLEKYEKIATGLRNDPELQQRLQGILQG